MKGRYWCSLQPGDLRRARIRDAGTRLLLISMLLVPLPVLGWALGRQAPGESMETLKIYIIASFIPQWIGVLLTVLWMRRRQRPLARTRVTRQIGQERLARVGSRTSAAGPSRDSTTHLGLGRYECDLDPDWVLIRDNSTNSDWRLPRESLSTRSRRRVDHRYVLAVAAAFALALFLGVLFISQAFEITPGQFVVLMAGTTVLMVSPFILRLLFSGFLVLFVYAFLCGLHWYMINLSIFVPTQSPELIFYPLGMIPYIISKLFGAVWAENDVLLESGGVEVRLRLSDGRFERLSRALGHTGEV